MLGEKYEFTNDGNQTSNLSLLSPNFTTPPTPTAAAAP
jgi:hypothetical protein